MKHKAPPALQVSYVSSPPADLHPERRDSDPVSAEIRSANSASPDAFDETTWGLRDELRDSEGLFKQFFFID